MKHWKILVSVSFLMEPYIHQDNILCCSNSLRRGKVSVYFRTRIIFKFARLNDDIVILYLESCPVSAGAKLHKRLDLNSLLCFVTARCLEGCGQLEITSQVIECNRRFSVKALVLLLMMISMVSRYLSVTYCLLLQRLRYLLLQDSYNRLIFPRIIQLLLSHLQSLTKGIRLKGSLRPCNFTLEAEGLAYCGQTFCSLLFRPLSKTKLEKGLTRVVNEYLKETRVWSPRGSPRQALFNNLSLSI